LNIKKVLARDRPKLVALAHFVPEGSEYGLPFPLRVAPMIGQLLVQRMVPVPARLKYIPVSRGAVAIFVSQT
jgi:hypothetical protein